MNWRKLFQALALVAALAGAWWIWAWLHPPPEKVIRKQMEKLSVSLSSRAQGNIALAAAVNRALSIFSSDVYINGEGVPRVGESITGKTELQQAIFAAKRQLEGDVTFEEVHITVGPEQTNAIVTFSAVARLSGQTEPYSADLKAHFKKVEGDWLIGRIDPINVPLSR